jgi:hypothetical protein
MLWWDKYFIVSGDYMEVSCVPSATHVPCKVQSQNTVLAIIVFVTYFLNLFVLDTSPALYTSSCVIHFSFHCCAGTCVFAGD